MPMTQSPTLSFDFRSPLELSLTELHHYGVRK